MITEFLVKFGVGFVGGMIALLLFQFVFPKSRRPR